MILPIPRTLVGAGGTTGIVVRTQCPGIFKVRRLTVAHECARRFVITDIKVGMRSQFGSPSSVLATAFLQHLPPPDMDCHDTIQQAMDLTVSVENIWMHPETFWGFWEVIEVEPLRNSWSSKSKVVEEIEPSENVVDWRVKLSSMDQAAPSQKTTVPSKTKLTCYACYKSFEVDTPVVMPPVICEVCRKQAEDDLSTT